MTTPDSTSFADLMNRLRQGDGEAARLIFEKYTGRLISLARQHLDAKIRAKVDPEDVVQSALKSFFCRQANGDFLLNHWGQLWSLLAAITLRKCTGEADYYRAARRDIRHEVSPAADRDSFNAWEAIARDPTPSEALMLTELVEQVMFKLEGRQREIFSLTLQGFAPGEIKTQVRCSERTVLRALERVKEQLGGLAAEK